MKFTSHILASILLLFLFPLFGNKMFIIMFASIFIDFDHIYLLVKQRLYSIKQIKHLMGTIHSLYRHDPNSAFKDIAYIFHTVEFNIILLFLAFWYPVFFYICAGFIFHILTDVAYHWFYKMPILRWLFFIEFLRYNKPYKKVIIDFPKSPSTVL